MMPAVLDRPAVAASARTLEIVVSHEDIRNGVQGMSGDCAVAVALQRAGHQQVYVQFMTVVADGVMYDVPDELRDWLRVFDTRREFVHPARWVLSPREDVAS